MTIEHITIGISTLSLFLSLFVYQQTNKIHREQKQQTDKIHHEQKQLTDKIHHEQKQLTTAQAFIPIWSQLSTIRNVNLKEPNWKDISDSANRLEFMVIAYRIKLLNQSLLVRVYGRLYVETFEQIYSVKDETGAERGKTILESDCPITIGFYRKLCTFYKRRDITIIQSNDLEKDN